MPARLSLLAATTLALAACAAPLEPPAHPTPPPPPAVTSPVVTSSDGACPGKVEAAEGLREVEDGALLQKALGQPHKGGLCAAKVFEATRAVTVYRVWNKAKPETLNGRWWSFQRPAGPVDSYRAANAICPEWSALDAVSQCKLKVGARVVVGPGQSADCKETKYPASATNQVFVPNDTRDPAKSVVFVEDCTPGAAWP